MVRRPVCVRAQRGATRVFAHMDLLVVGGAAAPPFSRAMAPRARLRLSDREGLATRVDRCGALAHAYSRSSIEAWKPTAPLRRRRSHGRGRRTSREPGSSSQWFRWSANGRLTRCPSVTGRTLSEDVSLKLIRAAVIVMLITDPTPGSAGEWPDGGEDYWPLGAMPKGATMNADPIHIVRHIRNILARHLGVHIDSVVESRGIALISNQRARAIPAYVSLIGALSAVAYVAPRDAMAQSGPSPIPERAFAACQSKAKGDACSIYFGEHELKGTCVEEPSGSRLVCRPDDMPAPPR